MKFDKCVFCKIAQSKDLPLEGKLIDKVEYFVMLDSSPQSLGHLLVISKKHYSNLAKMPTDLGSLLFEKSVRMGELVKQRLGAKAYTIKVNNGLFSLESKDKNHVGHVHLHVISRYVAGEVLKENPKRVSLDQLLKIKNQLLNIPTSGSTPQ